MIYRFLLGIIWKRVNAQAAITTLIAGLALLVLRLSSEIYYQADISAGVINENLLFGFATINFAHMAIFMFLFSVALCILVSLATSPPDYKQISGLSFGTLTKEHKLENKGSYDTVDVVLSVVLVAIVIGILMYFTN